MDLSSLAAMADSAKRMRFQKVPPEFSVFFIAFSLLLADSAQRGFLEPPATLEGFGSAQVTLFLRVRDL